MFFAFGLFDGNPVQKGEKYAHCDICGYDGMQPIFVKRKWLMILIPFPIKTYAYIECPRCGSIKPLPNYEYKNYCGR